MILLKNLKNNAVNQIRCIKVFNEIDFELQWQILLSNKWTNIDTPKYDEYIFIDSDDIKNNQLYIDL
jgi:hypothetical protein